jgi:hypothetical protein
VPGRGTSVRAELPLAVREAVPVDTVSPS